MRRLRRAAVAVALWTSVARAQDPTELEGVLDQPIATTATKSAETTSSAPGMVRVLTGDELMRHGMRTLAEAMDFLSLGMMTEDNLLTGEIGARGIIRTADNADHVLLLVNGHMVNEPLTGGARFNRGSGIPIEFIDHIEIIVGPGSVLYGTGAMLGVVNVITKTAETNAGYHVLAESELATSGRGQLSVGKKLELFGHEVELATVIEYYGKDGPSLDFPRQFFLDPRTGAPGRFSRGPPDGVWGGPSSHTNTMQVPTGHVRIAVGELELNLRGTMFRRGYQTVRTTFDDPEAYRNEFWWSLDVQHRLPISRLVVLKSRAYADSSDYLLRTFSTLASPCLTTTRPSLGAPCTFEAVGSARWAGLEERVTLDWLHTGKLVTMAGFDGRLRFVGYKEDALLWPSEEPASSTTAGAFTNVDFAFGLYAQQTWDPVRWFGANVGLRIDRDERFAIVPSPRAAVVFRPWARNTLKFSASQAFRAPSWFETNARNPNRIAPADLAPEIVRTAEATMEQAFGTQRIVLCLFGSRWNDMVTLVPLTQAEKDAAFRAGLTPINFPSVVVQQFRNQEKLVNYGASLGFEGTHKLGRLRYGINATGTRTHNETLGAPLTVGPSVFGNARVSYDFGDGWPTIGLASYYHGRRSIDLAYTPGFFPPPYAPPQIEARLAVTGTVPHVTRLSYTAFVNAALSDEAPYAAGPAAYASVDVARNALQPVERFRATVGLQYDF